MPGHRTQCTACGSWLWRGHKNTAYPRKRSARHTERETGRGCRELLRGKTRRGRLSSGQDGKTDFPLMDHWASSKHSVSILFMPQSLMPSLSDWTLYLSISLSPPSLSPQPFNTSCYFFLCASMYLALLALPFAKGLFASAQEGKRKTDFALFTQVWGIIPLKAQGILLSKRHTEGRGELAALCAFSLRLGFHTCWNRIQCWRQEADMHTYCSWEDENRGSPHMPSIQSTVVLHISLRVESSWREI